MCEGGTPLNTSETVHTPVRLQKNRCYPTYQLYAVTRSKKAPETVLIITAFQTMQWLRERLNSKEETCEVIYNLYN